MHDRYIWTKLDSQKVNPQNFSDNPSYKLCRLEGSMEACSTKDSVTQDKWTFSTISLTLQPLSILYKVINSKQNWVSFRTNQGHQWKTMKECRSDKWKESSLEVKPELVFKLRDFAEDTWGTKQLESSGQLVLYSVASTENNRLHSSISCETSVVRRNRHKDLSTKMMWRRSARSTSIINRREM